MAAVDPSDPLAVAGVARWHHGPSGAEWGAVYRDLLGYAAGGISEHQGWIDLVHPDDRALARATLEGANGRFTARFLRAGGGWLHLRVCFVRKADCVEGLCVDVSEERLSSESIGAAVEAAGAGLWDWDIQNDVLRWSAQLHGLLDEALPDRAISFGYFAERVHPEDRPEVSATVQAQLDGKVETYDTDMRLRRANGSYRWVRVVGTVVARDEAGKPLRMVGQALDIDAAVETRQAVSNIEERLQLFVEHTPAAVAMFDTEMRYVVASRDWSRQYGLGDQDLVGRCHYDVFPTIPDRWKDDHRRAMAGEELSDDRDPFAREDGTVTWVRWKLFPWRNRDGSIGGIIMFTEVVNDQVEHELNLEEARERAERANEAKSEFLAHMSHEIRTPMNGVLGTLELLLDRSLEPPARELATTALRSGEALLAIINDILDFSKVEAGKLELEKAPFDLRAMTAEVATLFGPMAKDKRIDLRSEVDRAVGWGEGDATRIRQVVLNLLNNALKFTRDGHVGLSVRRLSDREVRIEVEDTGIGIDTEAQTRLFQSFQQGDSSISRRFGGTGLGLAISKRLVELMGGRLGVSSTPGAGSTFWFEIPFPVSEPPRAAGTGDAPSCALVSGLDVLLVDDNAVNRMVGARFVQRLGHRVETADHGLEVLMRLDRGERYDLILMDVQMPEMDGLTATRVIRSRADDMALVPIIAVTAHAMASDAERCRAAGMNDYISKPVRGDALAAAISRVLG